MIIDFHTHIFPDQLADKAVAALVAKIDNLYTPFDAATVSKLLKSMDRASVDISVIQPVITKQSQTKSTNEWAAGVRSDRIAAFGGIFPHTDDYKRDIDFVADLGLKGLKFHPEYQDFVIDDSHMLKIYDYALGKGLILLFHAGVDPGFIPPYKSSPPQFVNIVRAMHGGVIVAAHLGGHAQWDDVEEYLAGEDIYLDTSTGLEFYSHEQFLRIVRKHGADRVLFGSDSPWTNPKTEIEHLRSLPLSDEEKALILGRNAERLLGDM